MIREIMLCGIVLISVLSFISAMNWPLNKEQTCGMFNKTTDCDSYWCTQFLNGSWTNDLCMINQEINITNSTQTNATNFTDYFNKTEMNSIIGINLSNQTNFSVIQFCQALIDNSTNASNNFTLSVGNSILNRLDKDEADINSRFQAIVIPNREPTPYWLIALAIIAICGVIAYFGYMSMNRKKTKFIGDEEKPIISKSRKKAEDDKEEEETESKEKKSKQKFKFKKFEDLQPEEEEEDEEEPKSKKKKKKFEAQEDEEE